MEQRRNGRRAILVLILVISVGFLGVHGSSVGAAEPIPESAVVGLDDVDANNTTATTDYVHWDGYLHLDGWNVSEGMGAGTNVTQHTSAVENVTGTVTTDGLLNGSTDDLLNGSTDELLTDSTSELLNGSTDDLDDLDELLSNGSILEDGGETVPTDDFDSGTTLSTSDTSLMAWRLDDSALTAEGVEWPTDRDSTLPDEEREANHKRVDSFRDFYDSWLSDAHMEPVLAFGLGTIVAVALARFGPLLAAVAADLSIWTTVRAVAAGVLKRLARVVSALRYSRYDDSDPLEHEVRASIYETVESAPGVHLSGVSDAADVPLSTVRHHLRVLERENLLVTAKLRGKRRFYPIGSEDVELAAALEDEATAAVLGALADHEPASVSTLAAELDRDASTVSHHLSRLAEDGLVERERDGRQVLNRLPPAVRRTFDAERAPADAPAATAHVPEGRAELSDD